MRSSKARTLRVERTLSDDGKSIDTPKCGFGRRVDLSNEAVRTLRVHLTQRRERKLRRAEPMPQCLFASTTGTHADPTHVRQVFSRVCVAAGFTKIVDSPGGGSYKSPAPHDPR
jgi:hypothetical protein